MTQNILFEYDNWAVTTTKDSSLYPYYYHHKKCGSSWGLTRHEIYKNEYTRYCYRCKYKMPNEIIFLIAML